MVGGLGLGPPGPPKSGPAKSGPDLGCIITNPGSVGLFAVHGAFYSTTLLIDRTSNAVHLVLIIICYQTNVIMSRNRSKQTNMDFFLKQLRNCEHGTRKWGVGVACPPPTPLGTIHMLLALLENAKSAPMSPLTLATTENYEICCHQMSDFKAKMHQIVCRLGIGPEDPA